MKKIILPLLSVIAFITLPSFKAAPAEVLNAHFEQEYNETLINPCTGDALDVTGYENYDFHGVANKNRVTISSHGRGTYTAVDALGRTYIGHAGFSLTEQFPITNGATVFNLVYQVHFIGQGSAPNYKTREQVHVTLNANGTATVTRVNSTVVCSN